MARNPGGAILAAGIIGVGVYYLYKQGKLGTVSKPVQTGAVGAPTPVGSFVAGTADVLSGLLQAPNQFGLTGVTFDAVTSGGSKISIFEPGPNNSPAGTELPGED